jgi:acyl carrier protein
MTTVETTIRTILDKHGKLAKPAASLDDDDDLYQKGLSSHASVNVMLALEDEFDFEFPDSLLTRATFESVSSIKRAMETLGVPSPPEVIGTSGST